MNKSVTGNLSQSVRHKWIDAYVSGMISREEALKKIGYDFPDRYRGVDLVEPCRYCGEEYKPSKYGDYCNQCFGPRSDR